MCSMINHLVLDVGGVLTTNLSPMFWDIVAEELSVDRDILYIQYKEEMSNKLWIGEASIEQFWSWLEQSRNTLSKDKKQYAITSSLLPLPALQLIPTWSLSTHIHIMSNHRTEWILPILHSYIPYMTSIHISDQSGYKKPDFRFYHQLQQQFSKQDCILFVDDTPNNLLAAQSFGWQTLQADEAGEWTNTVTKLLTQTYA